MSYPLWVGLFGFVIEKLYFCIVIVTWASERDSSLMCFGSGSGIRWDSFDIFLALSIDIPECVLLSRRFIHGFFIC